MSTQPHRSFSLSNLLVRMAIGVVILVTSIGIFAALVATRPTPPQIAPSELARSVRVLKVRPVEISRQWLGYGTTRPLLAADISAEVAATVRVRPESIEPGVSVRKGDLILELDDSEFQARADRAQQAISAFKSESMSLEIDERTWEGTLSLARENVRLLKSELEKLQAAVAASGASAIELDRLRREITRAERDAESIAQLYDSVPARRAGIASRKAVEEATLRLAQIDIERTRITAPFDGRLQEVAVRVGERVAPGAMLARLVNLQRMETPVRVPVSSLADIAVGSRVDLLASGTESLSWTGSVARIAPEADAQTRTATVFVETSQNPETPNAPILQPGRFVTARVHSRNKSSSLVVPRAAINGDRVLIVDETGRAHRVAIIVAFHIDQVFAELDPEERQWAVIDSGLAAGDRVIISNLDEILPGMMIRPPADAPDVASAGASSTVAGSTMGGGTP